MQIKASDHTVPSSPDATENYSGPWQVSLEIKQVQAFGASVLRTGMGDRKNCSKGQSLVPGPPPAAPLRNDPLSPAQPACAGSWALYRSTTSLLGAERYMVAPCAGCTSGGASCHLPTRPSVAPSGQQSLPTSDFPQLRPLRMLPPLQTCPGGWWGGRCCNHRVPSRQVLFQVLFCSNSPVTCLPEQASEVQVHVLGLEDDFGQM